jgi:hypothetical protein
MTEPQRNTLYRQETGNDVPVSFVVNNIIPRKESMMSKLGCFIAGALAGAAALTAAAFLIDGIADKPGTSFDSEEDPEQKGDEKASAESAATEASDTVV